MSVKSVDLPDECWELIFRSFNHHRHCESLSLVCKQFRSITNRLRSSLSIVDPTIPFLPKLFVRFPRLGFIDFSHLQGNLNRVLRQISRSGLDLDSLNISDRKSICVDGLRELGLKMRNLRVLTCSGIPLFRDSDLLAIADSFPFLEELDISFCGGIPEFCVSDSGISALTIVLKNLRRVNLSGNYLITDVSLLSLCKNCEFLIEIAVEDCHFITQAGIASAIRHRPCLTSFSFSNIGNRLLSEGPNSEFIDSLRSLKTLTAIEFSNSYLSDELLCSIAEESLPLTKLVLRECYYTHNGLSCLLSKCQSVQYLHLQKADFLTDQNVKEFSFFLRNVTYIDLSGSSKLTNSSFLTLIRNCPLLNEIKLEQTKMGLEEELEEDCLTDFVVCSQVRTLYLGKNFNLSDKDVKRLASICPNLEHLDLCCCWGITDEGVVELLKKCCKIRHLSLSYCTGLNLFEIDFEVPKLEVLNLSETRIGDEALSIVSKTCCGLTHLDLQYCFNVTANGVMRLVQNCRGLREINLKRCNKLSADIIPRMVFSRPSLRKIIAPSGFALSEKETSFFVRHGCLIC